MIKTSSKPHIQVLLETLHRVGVRHIVCSPGSRNAPLMVSFDEDSRFETLVAPDERSAGFLGLGLSLEGAPAVLVCTSGSAAINYGPALAEAQFINKPLIALTADRPKSALAQWESQTINQQGLFQNFVDAFFEIEDGQPFPDSLSAVELANCCNIGPVHINYHLSEPLYAMEEVPQPDELPKVSLAPETTSSAAPIPQGNTLILLGYLHSTEVEKINQILVDNPGHNAVILSENTNTFSSGTIASIDLALTTAEAQLNSYTVDTVVTFGRILISRKIKTWLKAKTVQNHIHFHAEDEHFDPFGAATVTTNCQDFTGWFKRYLNNAKPSEFKSIWDRAYASGLASLTHFKPNSNGLTDFEVFRNLNSQSDFNGNIHVANSSAIRYFQLFQWGGKKIHCNRGVSGIDGTNSTAWGNAFLDSNSQNWLVTGDISFHYDSNFAWNSFRPANFKIILINNGGGGIFRFIPGPDTTQQLASHFEFNHQRTAENWAKEFGFTYYPVSHIEDFETSFKQLANKDDFGIVEVFTQGDVNGDVLRTFFKELKGLLPAN